MVRLSVKHCIVLYFAIYIALLTP